MELENIIQALYELSDADMARIETYNEAETRVKQLFLTTPGDNEPRHSVTKSEFVEIVQKDTTIMKIIDCRPIINKRVDKVDHLTTNLFKKQLKFKPSIHKSLSDSTLTATNKND
jgi:hypothetical protein